MANLRTAFYYPIFIWLIIAIVVLLFVIVMQVIYETNECWEQFNVKRKVNKLLDKKDTDKSLIMRMISTKKNKNPTKVAPGFAFDGNESDDYAKKGKH